MTLEDLLLRSLLITMLALVVTAMMKGWVRPGIWCRRLEEEARSLRAENRRLHTENQANRCECGEMVKKNAKYCSRCGKKIGEKENPHKIVYLQTSPEGVGLHKKVYGISPKFSQKNCHWAVHLWCPESLRERLIAALKAGENRVVFCDPCVEKVGQDGKVTAIEDVVAPEGAIRYNTITHELEYTLDGREWITVEKAK